MKRQWLREIRENKGFSLRGLQKEVGVSYVSLCDYERGVKSPKPRLAKKIGDVLDFDWTRFYEDEDEETEPNE